MAWFKKLYAWIISLFRKPKPPQAGVGPVQALEPAGEICALNVWIGEIDQRRQLDLLFNCGVVAWNSRRSSGDQFWPDLSNVDFHARARNARTMVWGKPTDLAGQERVVLADINLENANLESVLFVSGDVLNQVRQADPDGKTFGADLRRANLVRSKLKKARLTLSNLEDANLEGADLRDADLRKANFARANLRNANMLDAKLEGANFAWADLSGAIVSAKSLEGANLFGAKLSHTSVLGYQPTGLVFGRNLMSSRVRLVPTLKSAWS